MEVMSLNNILRDDITKLASSLIPHGFEGDVQTLRLVQDCLSTEINIIGEKSGTEQGTTVVTSVEKLLNSDGFVLYLLKDAQANDGKGALIGILKVEKKKLFLTDERAVIHKLEPLCVLDFYVVGEYQRKGLGKRLFSYMLKDLNTTTDQIAIDEPSTKLENFLNKNYGMKRLIRQNNNFAISPQFFENLEAIRKSAHIAPPVLRVGRFTARKPISDIGNIIHGSGSQNSVSLYNQTYFSAAPLESYVLHEHG